jgi:hypothetical protein
MSGRGRSGDGPPAEGGALGPVEAAEGTAAARPAPPAVRLLTRRQRFVLAGLFAAVVAVLAARHPGRHPPPAVADPPPLPSQVSHFHYAGQVAVAGGPGGSFALRLRAEADSPFEVTAVRSNYPGLSVSVAGGLPVAVAAQGAAVLTVDFRVTDCAGAPPDAGMPLLDVTLRNTRAIETVSQILGAGYARDLSENLHAACPNSAQRTPTSATEAPNTPVR